MEELNFSWDASANHPQPQKIDSLEDFLEFRAKFPPTLAELRRVEAFEKPFSLD